MPSLKADSGDLTRKAQSQQLVEGGRGSDGLGEGNTNMNVLMGNNQQPSAII